MKKFNIDILAIKEMADLGITTAKIASRIGCTRQCLSGRLKSENPDLYKKLMDNCTNYQKNRYKVIKNSES